MAADDGRYFMSKQMLGEVVESVETRAEGIDNMVGQYEKAILNTCVFFYRHLKESETELERAKLLLRDLEERRLEHPLPFTDGVQSFDENAPAVGHPLLDIDGRIANVKGRIRDLSKLYDKYGVAAKRVQLCLAPLLRETAGDLPEGADFSTLVEWMQVRGEELGWTSEGIEGATSTTSFAAEEEREEREGAKQKRKLRIQNLRVQTGKLEWLERSPVVGRHEDLFDDMDGSFRVDVLIQIEALVQAYMKRAEESEALLGKASSEIHELQESLQMTDNALDKATEVVNKLALDRETYEKSAKLKEKELSSMWKKNVALVNEKGRLEKEVERLKSAVRELHEQKHYLERQRRRSGGSVRERERSGDEEGSDGLRWSYEDMVETRDAACQAQTEEEDEFDSMIYVRSTGGSFMKLSGEARARSRSFAHHFQLAVMRLFSFGVALWQWMVHAVMKSCKKVKKLFSVPIITP
eukprot:CAMPEP_0113871886 /NCGR_PEP_ID=MMETSP0780_2-20120614/2895_1 /TAXON_ID=652834 /ORGANISM="Palpitomonas bilix" /LENGTH=467 /DNA_ID=CAMNT_0000857333 /DNA_START=336 /DNA_END=1739 /DNA_ORIENTATION=- /assembly_acc=CAM_ASM_000599